MSRCPDGTQEHGELCYELYRNELSRVDAKATCQRTGGELVSINSQLEQDFIAYISQALTLGNHTMIQSLISVNLFIFSSNTDQDCKKIMIKNIYKKLIFKIYSEFKNCNRFFYFKNNSQTFPPVFIQLQITINSERM